MNISLNWIKQYIDIDKSASEIEDALNMMGLEVDGVTETGLPPLENIVVGEVLTREQHPNADRLSVCTVSTGENTAPHHIVCGATNFKVGDRVPVALPGAELPGGFKIKKSKLRGEVSEGMMCSERELGLGDNHEGLLILDNQPTIGTAINDVFTDSDTVLDVFVTPNRADCLSHVGIARELAAYFGLSLRYPEIKTNAEPQNDAREHLIDSVSMETPENCPHYRAYSIHGVKIDKSPKWLQQALTNIGMRPINNVVDVTNYVLHELGQPLHAFDAKKIKGNKIVVRQASEGEKITTLDDKERELDPSMTVIADAESALVVAGVMGSIDAEVDDSTTDIVLESAYFNPTNVRRTSKLLGLSSDSSYRFERGVDPQGTEFAALRAIDLIIETAGGTLVETPIVGGAPSPVEKEITITPKYICDTIGFPVEPDKIKEIFEALLLNVHEFENDENEQAWRIEIPSYRLDLDRPIDLVEEFVRIYGTPNIPAATVSAVGLQREDDPIAIKKRDIGQHLKHQGYNECVHYTTVDGSRLTPWIPKLDNAILELANPLASDQSHLRTSLVPGLLDALKLNRDRGNDIVRLFETGHVFRESNGQLFELVSTGFLLVQSPQKDAWKKREAPDFYTTRNTAEEVLRTVGARFRPSMWQTLEQADLWQNGHAAHIGSFSNGFEARVGMLNLQMLKEWDIQGSVQCGVVEFLPEFLRKPKKEKAYQPFSLFPPVTKDLAIVVDTSTNAGKVRDDLENVAKKAAGSQFNLESVNLFDLYEGEGVADGKKSLAFNLVFRSPKETLTDAAVNKVFDEIQKKITKDKPYAIRT